MRSSGPKMQAASPPKIRITPTRSTRTTARRFIVGKLRLNRDLLDHRRRQRLTLAAISAEPRWRVGEGVHDLHPVRYSCEDDVIRRQIIVSMHDEKLTAVGIRPGVCHGDDPAPIPVAIE